MPTYDQEILSHYKSVAENQSNDDSCTMDDKTIRKLETSFILNSIASEIVNRGKNEKLKISDYGCGNGYTISKIFERFPGSQFSAFEYTPELRDIANKRSDIPCEVLHCDLRNRETLPRDINIVVCQRVLINLLNESDQYDALSNIIDSLSDNGLLISIEAFSSNLETLNLCRKELGLNSIPPAIHNKYLPDCFFDNNQLKKKVSEEGEDFLSTHYFITRVLHDVALKATGAPFVRNSLFVKYFDMALPKGIGKFSPLRCNLFRKIS
tara:strand:- start:4103 stop:4903 length:801 start_codon:yes stop_codon:yes gene_type:complete